MSRERYLKQTFGRQAPFAVPDGYFDSVARQVMDNLPPLTTQPPTAAPAARRHRLLRLLRPLAAAACLAGIVAGATLYLAQSTATEAQAIDMSQYYTLDYTTEQMADYAMLSNEDFYLYMTEE